VAEVENTLPSPPDAMLSPKSRRKSTRKKRTGTVSKKKSFHDRLRLGKRSNRKTAPPGQLKTQETPQTRDNRSSTQTRDNHYSTQTRDNRSATSAIPPSPAATSASAASSSSAATASPRHDEKKIDVPSPRHAIPASHQYVEEDSAWRLECRSLSSNKRIFSPDNVTLQKGSSSRYYEKKFEQCPHINFIGLDSRYDLRDEKFDLKALTVTVCNRVPLQDEPQQYQCMIRTALRDELFTLSASKVRRSNKKAMFARDKDIIKALKEKSRFSGIKFYPFPSHISSNNFLSLEEDLVMTSFKFGLLYVAPNQRSENDIFSNTSASKNFDHFCKLLGERIQLDGWEHYAGGLDVQHNSTGSESIYTRLNQFEVMFHVSTMLPFFKSDLQQIERKRHIGNDIVVIIFVDDDQPFLPSTITSIFNHVYVIVHVAETNKDTGLPSAYHFSIVYKPGVEEETLPLLPDNGIMSHQRELSEFLLTKLVNLETAAYNAPGFAPAIRRTRKQLINQLRIDLAQRSISTGSTPTPQKSRFAKIFGD